MRKHRHEEHANHEAWAIPYADLMTLLLAFFVVMYAVSVVNEGKFRVMSESLIEAFNGSSRTIAPLPPTRVRPHDVTPAIARPAGQAGLTAPPINLPIPPHPERTLEGDNRDKGGQGSKPENLDHIESQVRKALQPMIDRKVVVVRHTEDWLEIEIRTDILFPSGVAQLSDSANAVLQGLATILARFANQLRVEGFTDDVPISTALYPSNWELSAARAASVARLFSGNGIAPERLGIIGWGEMRPIADNATAEGRNQNRRVLVVVMSNRPPSQRELRTPENVRGTDGLAGSAAPASDVLPAARREDGATGHTAAHADAGPAAVRDRSDPVGPTQPMIARNDPVGDYRRANASR